jgi:hypothetical protein
MRSTLAATSAILCSFVIVSVFCLDAWTAPVPRSKPRCSILGYGEILWGDARWEVWHNADGTTVQLFREQLWRGTWTLKGDTLTYRSEPQCRLVGETDWTEGTWELFEGHKWVIKLHSPHNWIGGVDGAARGFSFTPKKVPAAKVREQTNGGRWVDVP